jgi:hypothetical protein
VAGINSNTAWSLGGDGVLQGMFVARFNINKANIIGTFVLWAVTAFIILSFVWV